MAASDQNSHSPHLPADLDLSEVIKEIKYAKQAFQAWQATKQWRFKWFLRGLDAATGSHTSKQRRQFADYLKSDEGRHVLGDFVDAATRTSSITALSALALLFADTCSEVYSTDFRSATCEALDGISERAIDVFLAVMESQIAIESSEPKDPYPVCHLQQIVEDSAAFRELLPQPALQVSAVRALIRRGMLEDDFVSSRMSDEEGYGIWIGVTSFSDALHQLLTTARNQLRIDRSFT